MTALGRYTVIIGYTALCRSRHSCHDRMRSLGGRYRHDRWIDRSAPAYHNEARGDHQENEYQTRRIPGHGFRFRREYDNYLVGLQRFFGGEMFKKLEGSRGFHSRSFGSPQI